MPTDAELAFADQVGRHFARHYGTPPMTGRVAGWLLLCDPPQQTAADIAAALGVSRSAVGSAVDMLETWMLVRRSRPAGERADRIGVDPAFGMQGLEAAAEYAALVALARDGLVVLGDAPTARKERLLEMAAMGEFLRERLPALAVEWRERRDELRAAGELPDGP